MSTKIYNAFIFTDQPSVLELGQRMDRLRKSAWKILRAAYVKACASRVVDAIDSIALKHGKLYGDYEGQWLISHEVDEVDRRYEKVQRTSLRDPHYDFECNLQIMPMKSGKILMMVFIENRKIQHLLNCQQYLRDYSYWDNTDPDKDVSKEEWDQREKDWDELFKDSSVPAHHGFTVQLSRSHMGSTPRMEEMLKYILPRHERARRWAFHLAWEEVGNKKFRAEKRKNPKANPFDSFLRVEKYVRDDPKGQALVKQMELKARKMLPRRITKELIFQKLKKNPHPNKEVHGEENL